jgi:hypothetical protein
MEELDELLNNAIRKNNDGTLTIGEAFHFGFYRLLEGEHAGKVVIKSTATIDGKNILYFAKQMTWIYEENLKNVRCELSYPTFSTPKNEVDRSKASWFTDGGMYQCYDW